VTVTYDTKIAFLQGGNAIKLGVDANGLPALLMSGAATIDADISTEIGADALYADGSIYISIVDGAGKVFYKKNDVWTDLQAAP
jgi:hypothetical protein